MHLLQITGQLRTFGQENKNLRKLKEILGNLKEILGKWIIKKDCRENKNS